MSSAVFMSDLETVYKEQVSALWKKSHQAAFRDCCMAIQTIKPEPEQKVERGEHMD